MPAKADFTKLVTLYSKVCGGEPAPGQTLGAALGPLGCNAKAVNGDVQKVGNEWKGIRIIVEVSCQNRNATVRVKPTAGSQLVKAVGNYTRDRKKTKLTNRTGNVSFEEIKRIANWLHNDGGSMSKEMSGSVLQILGTARSIGLTVDGQNPKVITEQIKSGEIRV